MRIYVDKNIYKANVNNLDVSSANINTLDANNTNINNLNSGASDTSRTCMYPANLSTRS